MVSLSRQCVLLGLSRSGLYYTPRPASAFNLSLMRQIDEIFLECPFYGTRQMCRHLRNQGWKVGRRRVKRLMRTMGLMAIYQTPKTTTPNPEHKKYPYLLKNIEITHTNQVWSTDISVPQKRRKR